ncbi:BSD domain-containing protein 1 [Dermatophagoides farinae]|uniref:BSD domain-containing protein 1 n=1 Tax=Dermatophagoides farinae TaxID=6954 RepID=A0A922KX46_DERFA|nr:BSD domain-containing protein 1 [Dermatophagoides farinae]
MSESTIESSDNVLVDPKLNDETKIDQTSSNDAPEPSTSSSSFGGWFSNIVQQAKQTVSKTTMESIKRDLNELKDAVQNDTTNMMYSTASLVKNTFNEIGNTVTEIGSMGTNDGGNDEQQITSDNNKSNNKTPDDDDNDDNSNKTTTGLSFDMKSLNSWTDKFTETAKTTINLMKDTFVDSIFANEFYPVDELNDEPYVVIGDGQILPIDNWMDQLKQLQIDPNTYCREPAGPPDNFEQWLVKFNLINYQKQMEYLIENVLEISKFHKQLVPQTISDSDFWHRYFYNVYQLRERLAEEIREKHAKNSKQQHQQQQPQVDKNDKQSASSSSSISRSETGEWEKMNQNNNNNNNNNNSTERNSQKEHSSSKCSSDDDDRGDWVKM